MLSDCNTTFHLNISQTDQTVTVFVVSKVLAAILNQADAEIICSSPPVAVRGGLRWPVCVFRNVRGEQWRLRQHLQRHIHRRALQLPRRLHSAARWESVQRSESRSAAGRSSADVMHVWLKCAPASPQISTSASFTAAAASTSAETPSGASSATARKASSCCQTSAPAKVNLYLFHS